ncbi:hypothetical protein GC089_11810 [Cellulomonas sp. JZ18]|uniref:hypothetical protein n=1 Tax=Cellulomonas sp. JZ18 TaxID=2654191 RepID=UPI0012D45083|nr:hypothetical protein [Cellulomonas sp. JZ18]QGQ19777.1 hypothetical protein GC089_11810 [Cellulomonas sp. JZ18]
MDVGRTGPDGPTVDDGAVTPAPTTDGQDAGTTGTPGEDVPASVQALEEAVGLHGVDATQHAQELLAEHVPLTLLVDLLAPTGDTSADLLADEGLPADAWWDGDDGRPDAATGSSGSAGA